MRNQTTWLPREPDVVALLDAAYRVDRDEQSWSAHLTDAFAPSVPGSGFVGGLIFDASTHGSLVARATHSNNPLADAWMTSGASSEAAEFIDRMFPVRARVGSASETLGSDFPTFAALMRRSVPFRFSDAWSVAGANLYRQGYLLSVSTALPVRTLPPGLLRQWTRIAAHLSAAYCLRENMARGLAPDEGVLTSDGKLLHAEGAAKVPSAREALRHAVRGIDAARGRLRKQPAESLAAWQALVSGRWTLVEAHEHDGRRFLLARVNELGAPASKTLSARERQTVGLVAQGASNKEIAYRLGIGEPTVAGYLRRAKEKLGLRGRADLLRWAGQHEPPGSLRRASPDWSLRGAVAEAPVAAPEPHASHGEERSLRIAARSRLERPGMFAATSPFVRPPRPTSPPRFGAGNVPARPCARLPRRV